VSETPGVFVVDGWKPGFGNYFESNSPILGMKKIDRETAIQLGLRRFFTGVPCVRGHISERYAANAACLECHRSNMQRQKARDPEKARERDRLYQQKQRRARGIPERVRPVLPHPVETCPADWGSWTPERDATLLQLRPTMSAREIAIELGTTRSAVLGRYHRLQGNGEQYKQTQSAKRLARRDDRDAAARQKSKQTRRAAAEMENGPDQFAD
jgi:hypothetical protein